MNINYEEEYTKHCKLIEDLAILYHTWIGRCSEFEDREKQVEHETFQKAADKLLEVIEKNL